MCLDRKFVPHGAYGINHTKHNLEYGYLIVGLMQSSRKRVAVKTTKRNDMNVHVTQRILKLASKNLKGSVN